MHTTTSRTLPLTLLTLAAATTTATFLPAALVATLVRNVLFVLLTLSALELALAAYHNHARSPLVAHPKRYALVTGASSGIGREITFELARRGFSLVLAARTAQTLEKVQSEIEALYSNAPVAVETCACDLSTRAGIDALLTFVRDRNVVIDILVNNAGASMTNDFVDLTATQVEALVTLNVVAMTTLSHALIPLMIARGAGRVLNVASMSAAISIPTASLYGASKSFMLNASQAIDYELRGTGVRVTCVCPGPVHTNFGAAAHCDASIYMTTPGLAVDARSCAIRAVDALVRGDTELYDSYIARWGAMLFRSILPTRVGLLVAAVSMNEPRRALAMIQR